MKIMKLKLASLFILFLPIPLLAENFLSLKMSDLRFEDNNTPPEILLLAHQPWPHSSDQQAHIPSFLPYMRTADANESFLTIDKDAFQNRKRNELHKHNINICLQTYKTNISGQLFLLNKDKEFKPYSFSFDLQENKPKLSPEQTREEEYLTHRISHYQLLQEYKIPGGAWFRHQGNTAKTRLAKLQGVKSPTPNAEGNAQTRPTQKQGLEESMDLFSGGRAISENLQLDRKLRLSTVEQNRSIAISSMAGITIDEIPWQEWIKGKKPKLDPLANILPHDQHAVIFPAYSSMLEVMDEATKRGTPIVRLGEKRAESARSKEKYSQQLCLPVDQLSRLLGPELIASVAITGSDPFLRTGTSLTLIFEAKQKEALLTALAFRRLEMQKKFPFAESVKGKIPKSKNLTYEGLTSVNRSIRSFVSSIDNFVIVSNSLHQLSRIAQVSRGKAKKLASLEEYHFFRKRYPIYSGNNEDAFLMITDATIRRWCGPEWRIGASRRTRAASALAELQARQENGLKLNSYDFPELGKVSLIQGKVHSSKFGNLSFLKPVEALQIKKVTPAEKKAYQFFRSRYQSHWSRYFDPIAGKLSIGNEKIQGDLSILPLIGGTDYQEMVETVGQVKLKPESGDPHPEAIMHWASAIDMNSPKFKQVSNFTSIISPSLGTGALGWVGESFSVYLDDSPLFPKTKKIFLQDGHKSAENFIEKNFGKIPLGFNAEVSNPFKLTAFLAGLRAWIELASPGMTEWSNKSHKKQGYVKIIPGSGIEGDLIKEGAAPIALYYVPLPNLFTISLNEDIIKRAIDRHLARREKKAEGKSLNSGTPIKAEARENISTSPEKYWAGMSSAFQGSSTFLSVFDLFAGQHLRYKLQRQSWNNLYALNEWRILLKQKDPLVYHHNTWQTDLVCPGGGSYVWSEEFQTYESTVFGHPGQPKSPKKSSILGNWDGVDFGINFENNGLRVQASIQRKK